MGQLKLRAGHVQPVWTGHPWVFAQAVESVTGAPTGGSIVDVVDPRGQFLGRGFYSPNSAIVARILSRNPHDTLDQAWLGRRLDDAARMRASLFGLPGAETNGFRLVHGEGDGLPGLIVDVYGATACVQLLTVGMKLREDAVFAEVARVTGARTILEVASGKTQKFEGFEAETRVVRGPDVSQVAFRERGFHYEIEFDVAQKTGFYFDQRDNRAYLESLARDRTVLDAFSYVGGFSLAAARGGAKRVRAVDSSPQAVACGATVAHRNGLADRIEFVRGDLKRVLPELAQNDETFDIVIIDPPKLIPSARHVEQGRKAYRRLNASALRLVADGGVFVTCSCSAALRVPDFLRMIAMAARDAHREVTLFHLGAQGPDHPVPAPFPEGSYLKCAFLRVH